MRPALSGDAGGGEGYIRQIGLSDEPADIDPAELKWGELAAGTQIGETVGVFPRIDKNKVMSEIERISCE